MIKITSGYFGSLLKHKRGDIISLSEEEEKRLVDRNVAQYVQQEDKKFSVVSESEPEDECFLGKDEIRAMKKQELIKYAETIGVPEFDVKSTNDAMIDAILNFVEENRRMRNNVI